MNSNLPIIYWLGVLSALPFSAFLILVLADKGLIPLPCDEAGKLKALLVTLCSSAIVGVAVLLILTVLWWAGHVPFGRLSTILVVMLACLDIAIPIAFVILITLAVRSVWKFL